MGVVRAKIRLLRGIGKGKLEKGVRDGSNLLAVPLAPAHIGIGREQDEESVDDLGGPGDGKVAAKLEHHPPHEGAVDDEGEDFYP